MIKCEIEALVRQLAGGRRQTVGLGLEALRITLLKVARYQGRGRFVMGLKPNRGAGN